MNGTRRGLLPSLIALAVLLICDATGAQRPPGNRTQIFMLGDSLTSSVDSGRFSGPACRTAAS